MRRGIAILLIVVACGKETRSPKAPESTLPPKPQPAEGAPQAPTRTPPIDRDLRAIAEKGELAVLFTFNSTGYFIYRGETLGYEYELLSTFARERKLRIKPVVVRDSRLLFDMLDRGEGDVIAAQLVAGRDP